MSSRIREFSARGSDDYNAPSTDNSAVPFSVSTMVLPGAVVGANVVAFRCHERRDETRT